jgi:hypothetical protein
MQTTQEFISDAPLVLKKVVLRNLADPLSAQAKDEATRDPSNTFTGDSNICTCCA